MSWDEETVRLLARWTARSAALLFSAWMAGVGLAVGRGREEPARKTLRYVLTAFAATHFVHLLLILELARLTSGATIRERGGWLLVVTVGGFAYACIGLLLAMSYRAFELAPRLRPYAEPFAVLVVGTGFFEAYWGRALDSFRFLPLVAALGMGFALYTPSALRRIRWARDAV